MLYISLLLISLAGLSEAIMDTLQFHYEKSIFSKFNNQYFWNPNISWKNKYLNKDPLQGRLFPGSTSLFVFLTDGWHLFKSIRTLSLFLGLFILSIIGTFTKILVFFIIARVVFGLVFTLFFSHFLIDK
jgi:hypothetical protein